MGSRAKPTRSARQVRVHGNKVAFNDLPSADVPPRHIAVSSPKQPSEIDSEAHQFIIPLVAVNEAQWRVATEGELVKVEAVDRPRLDVLTAPGFLGRVPAGYVEHVLEERLFNGQIHSKGRKPSEVKVRLWSNIA